MLVLEELGHAQRRGVPILAEVMGYAATADANHITLPSPGGLGAVRAARRAFQKSGLSPDDVDYVNAHATSTPEGDPAELAAFRTIFGERAPQVAISATKSAIGHTLGAAGAIGSIAAIMAMRDGCIPPTLNLTDPDDAVGDLDLTPLTARPADVRVALVNAFGFGGQNTSILFRRWDA